MGYSAYTDGGGGGGSGRTWNRCIALVQRCSSMRQLKAIHAIFIAHGLHRNNYALSKLVEFCALSASGSLHYATLLFRYTSQSPNTFQYNTLIRAHSRGREPLTALTLFRLMLSDCNVSADHYTFAFALIACANIRSGPAGRQVHAGVLKNGLSNCDQFVQTGLVRMYAESCLLDEAHQAFDEITRKDAIMWNVLMNGYLRSGFACKALGLFRCMLLSNVEPDQFCVATGITACAHSGALQQGSWIHDYARKKRMTEDVFIGTSLVDMYAKCGCIDKAIQTFDEMPERNVISWSAIIGAFAMHGYVKQGLHCLNQMQDAGLRPDDIHLLNVLSACCHGGLKEEAYQILYSMKRHYDVEPKHEHFSCMVDLLCRAGKLEEALKLIREMPMKPLASVWGAMLSGARIFRNLEMAEVAAQELVRLEGDTGDSEEGVYVQLSSVYLAAGRLEDARRVRILVGDKGIKKTPGCSVIEVDGKVNEFVAGDEGHHLGVEIHEMLNLLHYQILLKTGDSFLLDTSSPEVGRKARNTVTS